MQTLTIKDATGGTREYVTYALAVAYTAHLMDALTPAQFELAVYKNEASRSRGVDHFHDNCDANQCLLDAAHSLFPNESREAVDEWLIDSPGGSAISSEAVHPAQCLAKDALMS